MDKTFFDRLNKLFVISVSERNHETLMIDQNLQAVVRDSQPYVIPTFPCFEPRVLVPDEHHVLKDLPFYEEASTIDAKARQGRLNKREQKRQEGTLRHAPSVGRSATSSAVHPSFKKKSVSWPVEKTLDLSPSSSSLSLSVDASSNQGLTGSPFVGVSPNREPELVVLCIILEPEREREEEEEEEEEAQMTLNLRSDFNKGNISAFLKHFRLHLCLLKRLARRLLTRNRFWTTLWCRCLLPIP